MRPFNNKNRFKRTLVAITLAMLATACSDDNNTNDTETPDPAPAPTNSAPVISSTSIDAATEGTEYNYTLAATDADGDSLTMTASNLPVWLAFDVSTGVLSGTAGASDVGDHAVTLNVSDGTASVSQMFTISVSALVVPNTAPSVTSTSINMATEGTAYTYMLTATDAEGDALTLAAPTLPSWLTFAPTTGLLTGTPATTDVGDNDVVLTVSDGSETVSQTFTIDVNAIVVANNPPVITSSGITSATVGTAYSYTLTATDADSDELTMSSVAVPAWAAFDTTTGILSGTPDMATDYDVELMVSDGTDAVSQSFTITAAEVSASEIVMTIFENAMVPEWAAWDCCGGTMPALVTDDVDHDQTIEFSIVNGSNGGTVVGFIARDGDGAVGGMPFDATNGKISFDLKLTQQPNDGPASWLLKVESNANNQQFSEVSLSTSNEAHTAPVLDTWQTYTFDLSDLVSAGTNLDQTGIDVIMVFPAWGTGEGAKFLLDNVTITGTPDADGGVTADELLTNGDFEDGFTSWKSDVGAIVTEGTNNIFEATIDTATTNVYDINQSQIFDITEGATYTFSFKAKASVARTMVAGLGLNSGDFFNISETISLTTEWQTFTKDIVAVGIGGAGSRVLFDMGQGVGNINIDDVSVKLKDAADNGGTTDPSASMSGGSLVIDVTNGINFEGSEEQQTSWETFENGDPSAPLEFVDNPSKVGNTSDKVAKFTALQPDDPCCGKFAGAVTRTVSTFKLSSDTAIAKIWVYKDKISPVGIKFERKRGDGYGSHGEITATNTKINEWEQLTIDFTPQIGLPENDEISGIAIFVDMEDGRPADSIIYFDDITFSSN